MAFIEFAQAKRDHVLLDLAKSLSFNEAELAARVEAEAVGTATWARRAPNAAVAGDLSLQVDIPLAVTNALALT